MTQSTDNKVVTLVPNRGLAPDLDVMADKLEQFAARIRAGEWPRLRHVLILLNDTDDGALRRQLVGRILPRGKNADYSKKKFWRIVPC